MTRLPCIEPFTNRYHPERCDREACAALDRRPRRRGDVPQRGISEWCRNPVKEEREE